MKCKCGAPPLRGKDVCLTCFLAADSAKQRKPPNHEEDDIQGAFFDAARTVFPQLGKLLFAVPNGGKRPAREAKRFQRQGVTRGVADILCLVPNEKYPFLCLETKARKGDQFDHQRQFQKEVEAIGGLYVVFRSAAEGIEILKDYLKSSQL